MMPDIAPDITKKKNAGSRNNRLPALFPDPSRQILRRRAAKNPS